MSLVNKDSAKQDVGGIFSTDKPKWHRPKLTHIDLQLATLGSVPGDGTGSLSITIE